MTRVFRWSLSPQPPPPPQFNLYCQSHKVPVRSSYALMWKAMVTKNKIGDKAGLSYKKQSGTGRKQQILEKDWGKSM